ncbi:MAG TPA: serine/threonine-protein kinase, partial [Acidobacteriota bacterium]|nr:serine/threonine-protein kinase [Acidobacteriota bacterium]
MAEFGEEIDRILSKLAEAPTNVRAGELRPGSLFAKRYEIIKKIGRGGMGVVYQATDTFLDIAVALKTMNPAISDERTLNRLKREVILARKISHPNVCRIYDIGESEGITYVSMELLEGHPLADILLKEGAMPIPDALLIVRQVLDAMEAAHVAGILHRDMKPQNIIIDPKGRAHIMDFGIATSADVSRLTQTGGLIGTPRYMSPEQFSGAKVDQRADIYSIGIILFEMLTGSLPYEANTPASVMYAHLNFPPKRPTQLISDLPLALENVILKSLEKDPAGRFQSVMEFRNALEPFLNSIAPFAPTLLDPISPSQSMQMVTKIPETVLEKPKVTMQPVAQESPAVLPPLQTSGEKKPLSKNVLIG